MIGSDALELLYQRLQRQTNPAASFQTWAIREMTQAQQRLENDEFLPWFLLTERAYEEVNNGDERVAVPSDFIREFEPEIMQIEDTSQTGDERWTELTKNNYDDMKVRFPNEEAGTPQQYDLTGGYFRLRPIPNKATFKLWMMYFARAATFATDAENLWLRYAADYVIAEAGRIMAGTLNNKHAMDLFDLTRKEEKIRLIKANVARDMANKSGNPEE